MKATNTLTIAVLCLAISSILDGLSGNLQDNKIKELEQRIENLESQPIETPAA